MKSDNAVVSSIALLWQYTNSFNTLSGSLEDHTKESFDLQRNLVNEESKELSDAFDQNDLLGQLDGAIDTIVTAMGYLQKLESTYGLDIAKACELVGLNNLSKYPTSEDIVQQTVEKYQADGKPVVWEYNNWDKVYIIKDATTGKVKKPYGYVSVDLSECIPTRN
jgi:hypothetical protein